MASYCLKKSTIQGTGIFATEDIKQDEPIFIVEGPVINYQFEPDYRAGANWMQVRQNVWKVPLRGCVWNYINHSCRPNTGIRDPFTVVAMHDIAKGEEITIDYSMVEAGRRWRMKCRCGDEECRKVIRGIQFLPRKIFLAYERYISPYLREIHCQEKTYVSRTEDTKRLFAKHPLAKNEVICAVEGPVIEYSFPPHYKLGYTWLAIGPNKWLEPLRSNSWSFIRHSCEPNVGLNDSNQLIAMRAIAPDEELVIDDSMTEADLHWRRRCSCGTASCRGIIRSVQYLDKALFQRYEPYVSTFIKRAYSLGLGSEDQTTTFSFENGSRTLANI